MKDGFSTTGRHLPHKIYATTDDLIMLADVYQDNWIQHDSSKYDALEFAEYLCHTANNYPTMMELLKRVVDTSTNLNDIFNDIKTLLNEISLLKS